MQLRLDEINKQIDAIRTGNESNVQQLKERDRRHGALQKEVVAVRTQLRAVTAKIRAKQDEKRVIRDKVKRIQDSRKAHDEKIKEMRQKLKLPGKVKDTLQENLDTVDSMIKKIEHELETTTMSMSDEKKKVAEIQTLRNLKQSVRDYHQKADANKQATNTKDLVDQIKALDKEVDAIREDESKLVKQMTMLRDKQKQVDKDNSGLIEQKQKVQKQLDALYDEMRKTKEALQKSIKASWEQKKAAREAREAQKQLERQKEQEEKRKRDLERKEEQLKEVPLQAEMDLCDTVAHYLSSLTGDHERALLHDKEQQQQQQKAAAVAAPSDEPDMIVLQPSSERSYELPMKKKNKNRGGKNKKRQNQDPTQRPLTYNMDVLAQFQKLGVKPPLSVQDIPACLLALKTKKEVFEKKSGQIKLDRVAKLEKEKAELEAKAATGSAAAATTATGDDDDAAAAAAAAAVTAPVELELPAPVLMDDEATAKLDAKAVKAAAKEGGKKGQDVAGMSDLGGLKFHAVVVEQCAGDLDLLKVCMDNMNKPVDEAGDDRKGGAGALAKLLLSAGDHQLAVCCHVPPALSSTVSGPEWMKQALAPVGDAATVTELVKDSVFTATVAQDKDKERFPLKDRDNCINASFAFLRSKNLVLDDSDDEFVDYSEAAGIEW